MTPPRWLEKLLHLHDTPRRTAAAFALGVFFSFSPFIGLQILASFAIAFLFGLNRLAVFIGLNANLPWILAPWYLGTTLAAAYVMGYTLPPDFTTELRNLFNHGLFTRDFWEQATGLFRPIVIPYLVGPTIGAAIVGLASYPIARRLLARWMANRKPEPG